MHYLLKSDNVLESTTKLYNHYFSEYRFPTCYSYSYNNLRFTFNIALYRIYI